MRLALAGRAYTGKTTLARALEAEGYTYWSYTDYLKELLARALHAIGVEVTVEQMHADKTHWRPLLVAFSERIHFDGGEWVRRFIEEQSRVYKGIPERLVWDNCRFPAQYEALRDYGFSLVFLDITDRAQFNRLFALGGTYEQWKALQHEVTEQQFPEMPGLLRLDATLSTRALVHALDAEAFRRAAALA